MSVLLEEKKVESNEKIEIISIFKNLIEHNYSNEFIYDCLIYSRKHESMYELLQIWNKSNDDKEKDEIIANIQDMIDDCQYVSEKPIEINLNDIDSISKNLRAFKDKLSIIVNEKGGIKILSEKTGIPQPSISRLLNSYSIPQRVTLLKIKNALGIDTIYLEDNVVKI